MSISTPIEQMSLEDKLLAMERLWDDLCRNESQVPIPDWHKNQAEQDLREGFLFNESQRPGLGEYFQTCLYSDIESLRHFGGVHRRAYKGYHRALSKRFPFAIFYTVMENTVFIHAVLDCRPHPAWIRQRISRG